MIGWEPVVGRVRDERNDVKNDERTRVVVEEPGEQSGEVAERERESGCEEKSPPQGAMCIE